MLHAYPTSGPGAPRGPGPKTSTQLNGGTATQGCTGLVWCLASMDMDHTIGNTIGNTIDNSIGNTIGNTVGNSIGNYIKIMDGLCILKSLN